MTDRLVTNETLGAWVFKCNPDYYDLPTQVADGETYIDNWSVADNYRSEMIEHGQKAILWVSGRRHGGIWATGWTTGKVQETSGVTDGYWLDNERGAAVRLLAPTNLRILDESDRLHLDDLRNVTALADLEVFTSPQSSNPSWVSKEQLAELEKRLPPWPAIRDVPTVEVTMGSYGAGYGSAAQNAKVERAAMKTVTAHYKDTLKAKVKDVHKRNLGWDLTATLPGGEEWHVEVKGVSGASPIVLLTGNECRVAERDDAWELAVVTSALTDSPVVTVYSNAQVLRNAMTQTVRADLRAEEGWQP